MQTLKKIINAIKPLIVCAIAYVMLIFFTQLIKNNISGFNWYKWALLNSIDLIFYAIVIIAIVVVVSKIKYVSTIMVPVLMTVLILVTIEAVYVFKYHQKFGVRNKNELKKELEEIAKATPSVATPENKSITDPLPIMPTLQELDTLPYTENDKNSGASTWAVYEPAWNTRFQTSDAVGYLNQSNAHAEVPSYSFGKKNSTVYYTTDSLGRRMTTLPIVRNKEKKYAAFFGCSIAFGLYVNDNQTMAAFFEGIDTNYVTYNYAAGGYGTHHMLATFESRNLKNEIPQNDGVAFYIYFGGHPKRAIGDMLSYLSWNADGPYYEWKGDSLVRNGSFKTGRWLTSWFYEKFSKTYFCKYYNFQLPGKLKSYHYEYTLQMIKQSYHLYQKQFGNSNFYVVLMPGWIDDDMKQYLDKTDLKVIDYNNLLSWYWREKYYFMGDGHPRPLFHKIVAQELHKKIKGL